MSSSLVGITEEVPGLPAIEPKASDPIEEIEATLPVPMDIWVREIASVIALLTLPMVAEGQ